MKNNQRTLYLYWQQVKRYKVSFVLMLICIPVGALVIDTVLPYLLAKSIGGLAEKQIDITTSYLFYAAGAGLFGAFLNFVGFRMMTIHEAEVMSSLRQKTFESLINKDSSFFSNQKIGAMTSRYIEFVRSEVTIQDLFVIRTLGFILSVGGGILILAFQSLPAAGVILFLVIVLILQIRWSTKKRAPWRHERKELVSEINGVVADTLTNNLIVKTFAAEEREIAALDSLTSRFRDIYKKDIGFISTEGSLRVLLMIVVQVAAITFASRMVIGGTLQIATAIFMLAYLQRIGSQLFVLSDIINGYDQAFLDASPMTEMIDLPDAVTDSLHATQLTSTKPTFKLDRISYHYSDSDQLVLSDITLEIPAGQKLGVVGHSGAGKTTISQLLLRFSDVTAGAICIDGNDIRDITQASLREHIAYVPQEPLLFHRSLYENIAYGKPNASKADITRAAEAAHALEFINLMPGGLGTIVGERGIKLSGGQRQRIAIARAILKDAPILILDEATSALDSESEKLIQDALGKLMKNRTSIVIAHRLSTIAKLDRIIVLDNGSIAEDGTHQELLARGGIYAKLWQHQSGGFIEE